METHAFGFRLRANAPEGQRRFSYLRKQIPFDRRSAPDRSASALMAVVQPPIRNPSLLGASVYGHSGEFGPTATDLRLTGRGLDLELVRSYRSSLVDRPGELGRGWSLNLAKRVERAGDELASKNQPEVKRNEASVAVTLYFKMADTGKNEDKQWLRCEPQSEEERPYKQEALTLRSTGAAHLRRLTGLNIAKIDFRHVAESPADRVRK